MSKIWGKFDIWVKSISQFSSGYFALCCNPDFASFSVFGLFSWQTSCLLIMFFKVFITFFYLQTNGKPSGKCSQCLNENFGVNLSEFFIEHFQQLFIVCPQTVNILY